MKTALFTWVLLSSFRFEPSPCLVQADAEKILGQTVTLTKNTTEKEESFVKYKCVYRATENESISNKAVNLNCNIEHYKDAETAHKIYAYIISQNSDMTGLNNLTDIGNEAFYHTDKVNFYLVMFRKNNIIFRVKINKLTNKASIEELMKVTKNIAATL